MARENSRMAKSTSRRIVVNFWAAAAAAAAVGSAKQIEAKREGARERERE